VKILFVCTGNSFRSPVAEALLKKLRKDLEVDSAGMQPAWDIAPNARELLKEENAFGELKKMPEWVGEKNLIEYDLIIVMEEQHKEQILMFHPQIRNKTIVWDVEDPINLPAGSDKKILEEIKKKVKKLADSL
jgi:protein-tyrosine phosphatase